MAMLMILMNVFKNLNFLILIRLLLCFTITRLNRLMNENESLYVFSC